MLTFDALTHTYQWCGKPVPSVTQAIGEWIPVNIYGTEYYVNAFTGLTFPAEKFRVAADWGTAVHAMNRLHLEGSLDRDSLHPDLLPVLGAFDDWLIAHKPKIILVETPMYSMRHGYAGTPDLICEIRRRLWVIDFKTGGYGMAGPQTAAYGKLKSELTPFKRGVLHFPKSRPGDHKFIELTNPWDWSFFQSRLYQHKYLGKGIA